MSSRPFSEEEYAAIISRLTAEGRLRHRLPDHRAPLLDHRPGMGWAGRGMRGDSGPTPPQRRPRRLLPDGPSSPCAIGRASVFCHPGLPPHLGLQSAARVRPLYHEPQRRTSDPPRKGTPPLCWHHRRVLLLPARPRKWRETQFDQGRVQGEHVLLQAQFERAVRIKLSRSAHQRRRNLAKDAPVAMLVGVREVRARHATADA